MDSGAATAVEAGLPEGAGAPEVHALSEPLPDVLTALSPVGAIARLDKASRRGRLPGFQMGPGGEDRCRVAAFGTPFDKEVLVRTKREGEKTRMDFETRLHWKMPLLLALILIVTIEPGQMLTDSLLRTYFGFYNAWTQDVSWFSTMLWYYPLTVPFVPFVWLKARGQTDATTWQSAHEAVRKIAAETGGELASPKLRRWTPKRQKS